jgi:DNA-binding MarR family transcriptional regulator/DNA-binding CsgD family transcriptional regulator
VINVTVLVVDGAGDRVTTIIGRTRKTSHRSNAVYGQGGPISAKRRPRTDRRSGPATKGGSVFEALNLDQGEELTYLALLDQPAGSVADLAKQTGLPPGRVSRSLTRLARRRLVHRAAGRPVRYTPTPPDVAISALVNERRGELDRTLLAVPTLLEQYRRAAARADPAALLEVLSGQDVAQARFLELMAGAASDVMAFDRQSAGEGTGPSEVEVEQPLLERGVRCRAVYEITAIEDPDRLPYIRTLAGLGEQARVLPQLPMKLIIFDHRLALLPLASASDVRFTVGVLVVHPSRLLDGLITLFEDYWNRAVALTTALTNPAPNAEFSSVDLETLALLCTGIKDGAMARQLGVSPRTLNRRIIRVMTLLGASSRFQAGLQAAKRGLL